MKRTARLVESKMAAAHLEDWIVLWRRRQFRWAGKVVRDDRHKWSYIALMWDPLLHGSSFCGRSQARPRKRWDTDFRNFAVAVLGGGANWIDKASSKDKWNELEQAFLDWSRLS